MIRHEEYGPLGYCLLPGGSKCGASMPNLSTSDMTYPDLARFGWAVRDRALALFVDDIEARPLE
jgi:hypothetical protein